MSTALPTTSLTLANRWLIVIFLMTFAAIGHFNRVSISLVGDEVLINPEKPKTVSPDAGAAESPPTRKQSFTRVFSKDGMGWVYFAFLVVYTACMLPSGWVIDRIGAGRALTLLGWGMGAFVVLTGALGWLASTADQLWIGLLVIRGLAGMCSAPLHPGAAHVVSDVSSTAGRATANGLVTAGALLGIAFCYPVFGKLMDWLTWQWAFVVCGLVMMAYGSVWSRFAAPQLPGPHAGHLDQDEAAEAVRGIPWKVVMRRDLWLVTLSYFFYSYYQYLFFYWMGYYFKEVLEIPVIQAREASFFITLAQGAGMAIGGMSTDLICRVLGIANGRRAIMMTGMGLCALLTMIAVVQTDFSRITWCIALAVACEGMCEGVYWTTATEIGGKSRGFAGGFLNAGGNVGGFISPILTPMMASHEYIGWTGAIAIACAFCAIGGVIWIWIKPPPASPSVAVA